MRFSAHVHAVRYRTTRPNPTLPSCICKFDELLRRLGCGGFIKAPFTIHAGSANKHPHYWTSLRHFRSFEFRKTCTDKSSFKTGRERSLNYGADSFICYEWKANYNKLIWYLLDLRRIDVATLKRYLRSATAAGTNAARPIWKISARFAVQGRQNFIKIDSPRTRTHSLHELLCENANKWARPNENGWKGCRAVLLLFSHYTYRAKRGDGGNRTDITCMNDSVSFIHSDPKAINNTMDWC